MAGGVDDGHVVLGRLELPEGDVDGDAALALRLQLVHHPGVFEGALGEAGQESKRKIKTKLPKFGKFGASQVRSAVFIKEEKVEEV